MSGEPGKLTAVVSSNVVSNNVVSNETDELNLLRPWREPVPRSRLYADTLGSALFHLALVAVLLNLPDSGPLLKTPEVTADLRRATPLYLPRELTQKDPNRGPISHSLDVRSALPPAPPPRRRFTPPAPAGPGAPVPPAPASTIEAPKIDVAQQASPTGIATALPPPPDKPKPALEPVTPPPVTLPRNPVIPPAPKISVEEATRAASLPSGGGVIVDDLGSGPAQLREYQLLSDPQGIDFKPYLVQVLAAVRRNWLAVIPESGRMGRRGLVQLQFSINRRGQVPKLVIASPSGTEAFDRAAVAGVSASNPFPPLPAAFKGEQIRLQLTFAYNLPSR